MSDGEIKQVQGICEEISEKNDWTTFSINVGSQYPVRLNSKLPAVIEQARSARGQQAVWTYKESQGNPNPNRPGTFYMNRYLEKVEVGGQMTMPSAPTSGAPQGAGHPATRDEGTNRSIERQTIVKALVPIYPVVNPATDAWWWNLLGKLDDFMVKGLPRPAQPGGAGPTFSGEQAPTDVLEQQAAETPPPDDDGIPF